MRRAPSDEHERVRLAGLRILARIIARRARAHLGRDAGRSPGEAHAAPRNGRPRPPGEQAGGDDES